MGNICEKILWIYARGLGDAIKTYFFFSSAGHFVQRSETVMQFS